MRNVSIAVLACLLLIPFIASAQGEPGWNKSSLGVNFELSAPVGDFADIAGTGYGGNVRYQWGADQRGVLTATAGYLVWSSKNLGNNGSVQPKAFTILVGGKYYFAPGFFGSLEGGFYFFTFTYEGTVLSGKGDTGRFMLPLGLGFQKSGWEIGARYMLIDVNYNCFSFTVGYNFTL